MALVKCIECSKQISDIAEICPSCGCNIKSYKENKEKRYEANAYAEYQQRKKKIVECISCNKRFNLYVSDKSKLSPFDDVYKRNPNHTASKIHQRRNQIKNNKISCTNLFLGEYTCIKCQKEIEKVEKIDAEKIFKSLPMWRQNLSHSYKWFIQFIISPILLLWFLYWLYQNMDL